MKTTGNEKSKAPKHLNMEDIKKTIHARKGVQKLSDYVAGETSSQLSALEGQTIYIVKLQPMQSGEFGDGFKIWYKDLPNARDTLQAHTFGQIVVPVLSALYANTHNGAMISLDSPVMVTVRKSGRSTIIE